MNNRYTPFGYCISNRAYTVVPQEAEIVKRIFLEYLTGESLKKIAAGLTEERVEYLPQKSQWNKNRIVRIISDVRYLGDEDYPAIIDEETFLQAQSVKNKRNTQTEYDRDTVISPSVVTIICGKCGCTTKRVHDKRSKFGQKYVCTNTQCKSEYKISALAMIRMISELVKSENLMLSDTPDDNEMLEIRRMEKEIRRAIDSPDTDHEKTRAMILECANQKYQAASKGRANFDKLEQNLGNADLQINRQTVTALASQIRLVSDEEIEITLINGQVLGKEQGNGAAT